PTFWRRRPTRSIAGVIVMGLPARRRGSAVALLIYVAVTRSIVRRTSGASVFLYSRSIDAQASSDMFSIARFLDCKPGQGHIRVSRSAQGPVFLPPGGGPFA